LEVIVVETFVDSKASTGTADSAAAVQPEGACIEMPGWVSEKSGFNFLTTSESSQDQIPRRISHDPILPPGNRRSRRKPSKNFSNRMASLASLNRLY
jgi:hypothetical protein